MVIVGITLGAVSLNAIPSERQVLQNDAQRIALLLQLARDEAIVRNRPIAFEAEADHYRFLLFEENKWQVLKQDDMFREREFKRSPVLFSVSPPSAEQTSPLRIIFRPRTGRQTFCAHNLQSGTRKSQSVPTVSGISPVE